jgi:hypothetical protein
MMNTNLDQELFFEILTASQDLNQIKRAQERFNHRLAKIRKQMSKASSEKIKGLQQNFPEVFAQVTRQLAKNENV